MIGIGWDNFLEELLPLVREEVEKWELSTWEEVIEIMEQVGDWGTAQPEDLG